MGKSLRSITFSFEVFFAPKNSFLLDTMEDRLMGDLFLDLLLDRATALLLPAKGISVARLRREFRSRRNFRRLG